MHALLQLHEAQVYTPLGTHMKCISNMSHWLATFLQETAGCCQACCSPSDRRAHTAWVGWRYLLFTDRTPCHQGGAVTSSCDEHGASPVLQPAAAPPPAPSRLQKGLDECIKAMGGVNCTTALCHHSISQSCVQTLTGAQYMLRLLCYAAALVGSRLEISNSREQGTSRRAQELHKLAGSRDARMVANSLTSSLCSARQASALDEAVQASKLLMRVATRRQCAVAFFPESQCTVLRPSTPLLAAGRVRQVF